MSNKYRKIYEKEVETIPQNYDIHHIDFDHDNNNLSNLIAVPKLVHKVIHQSEYCDRDKIVNLIKLFNKHTDAKH